MIDRSRVKSTTQHFFEKRYFCDPNRVFRLGSQKYNTQGFLGKKMVKSVKVVEVTHFYGSVLPCHLILVLPKEDVKKLLESIFVHFRYGTPCFQLTDSILGYRYIRLFTMTYGT